MIATTFATGACSSWRSQEQGAVMPHGNHAAVVATTVEDCRAQITVAQSMDELGLPAGGLEILSWNIHKNGAQDWAEELARLGDGKDLVLIQEAHLTANIPDALPDTAHWAFAPGYSNRQGPTGVMTLSAAPPIAQCSLITHEPWLGTPKATSITQYALANTNQSLIVANLHVVNFSLGLKTFRQQLDEVRAVLSVHDGPIILSGDFNTWSYRRLDVLRELAADLDLTDVGFEEDARKRPFNHALDHMFVRGLQVVDSKTEMVDSSDHNPLAAEFFNEDAVGF
ncbi:MAG: endonuclease/exonuclease/phosphatase family protein [Gammaproteobacteria bacterium]